MTERGRAKLATKRALMDRPLLDRQLLIMVDVDGLTLEEAAMVLDMPLGDVADLYQDVRGYVAEVVAAAQAPPPAHA